MLPRESTRLFYRIKSIAMIRKNRWHNNPLHDAHLREKKDPWISFHKGERGNHVDRG